MSTGVQRESDGPASENRHRCFVHRGLSQDKILPVRRQNAKRPTISWYDRFLLACAELELRNPVQIALHGPARVSVCSRCRAGCHVLGSRRITLATPAKAVRFLGLTVGTIGQKPTRKAVAQNSCCCTLCCTFSWQTRPKHPKTM
jgi:hypothetical protein